MAPGGSARRIPGLRWTHLSTAFSLRSRCRARARHPSFSAREVIHNACATQVGAQNRALDWLGAESSGNPVSPDECGSGSGASPEGVQGHNISTSERDPTWTQDFTLGLDPQMKGLAISNSEAIRKAKQRASERVDPRLSQTLADSRRLSQTLAGPQLLPAANIV